MPRKVKSIEELEKELSDLIKKKEKIIAQKKQNARKQDAHIKILIGGFVIKEKDTALINNILKSDLSLKDKELLQNLLSSMQNDSQKSLPQPLQDTAERLI